MGAAAAAAAELRTDMKPRSRLSLSLARSLQEIASFVIETSRPRHANFSYISLLSAFCQLEKHYMKAKVS